MVPFQTQPSKNVTVQLEGIRLNLSRVGGNWSYFLSDKEDGLELPFLCWQAGGRHVTVILYVRLMFQFSSFSDLSVIITKEHLSEIGSFYVPYNSSSLLVIRGGVVRNSSRAILMKAVSLVRKDRPLVSKTRTSTRTRFPNTKLCARMNQRHFSSKKW